MIWGYIHFRTPPYVDFLTATLQSFNETDLALEKLPHISKTGLKHRLNLCLNSCKVFIFLSIARFILGVGGVYPLAATVAAEGSSSACFG